MPACSAFCSKARPRSRITRRSCRRSNSGRPARTRRTSAPIRRARWGGVCPTARITVPPRQTTQITHRPGTTPRSTPCRARRRRRGHLLPIVGVSVADIDSSALTTTLSVASGILNVTAGAGVTGNGTASVTITGTAAQINAALAGLAYTGNLNFNGADTLTVATSDGTATDTDTIAITVNAVNDAPGQYRAGRAERRRGHHRCRSPASRWRTSTAARSPPRCRSQRHAQCDRPAPASPATAPPA